MCEWCDRIMIVHVRQQINVWPSAFCCYSGSGCYSCLTFVLSLPGAVESDRTTWASQSQRTQQRRWGMIPESTKLQRNSLAGFGWRLVFQNSAASGEVCLGQGARWLEVPSKAVWPWQTAGSRHRGNTSLTSLPLASVRRHGRVTHWMSR